ILCFPMDRAAYGALCRLLTLGKRRAEKGDCALFQRDLIAAEAEGDGPPLDGQVLVVLPPGDAVTPDDAFAAQLGALARRHAGRCFLAGQNLLRGDDRRRLAALDRLARAEGAPLVATNDVTMHAPERRPVADVLACIREGTTIDAAGLLLARNAERHLKPPQEMARLFAAYPEAFARAAEIAARCRFSLDELRYEYPVVAGGEGRNAQEELALLAWAGAASRWPGGVPAAVKAQVAHELALVAELGYAPYFLTVHDIVRFARSKGILCQGRGSAANSAVCYCLGITAVDPSRVELLFERFVSAERNEPPDIDVDFEHERREEVIQYIYATYGRERAGLAATVICYRARGAMREVGKAMGLSADTVSALSGTVWGWGEDGIDPAHVREAGLDPAQPRLALALDLARRIIGFPRHLSQHVGGFVITRGRLDEVVPIENAAMADRTVIEWDKDDLDALKMLKIDVLALGMLSCVRRGFDLIAAHAGRRYDLASVPAEDPAVYDMLCRADSLGVFQVESRAQMSMLPRLKPRGFYDLVIEVAIVRPGPIQGDMVHPYLRRREGREAVSYPSEELRRVLEKTLGVPLFQEQAMRIAIVAAGFSPSEADGLRRAMATFKKAGAIGYFRDKMIEGMVARGYERAFAERCFKQIEGFGTYGFPESHAASFALLVYVSAWMKCRHPAAFAAALLNSQPMGFYAPAQIVRDAREHGVEVRPPDVNLSAWDATLEPAPGSTGGLALRLGLREIKGFAAADAERLAAARGNGYPDPAALWQRAGLAPTALEALAEADAFRSMALGRREALWAVKRLGPAPLPLFSGAGGLAGEDEVRPDPPVSLPPMPLGEQVMEDYASLRLTLRAHPLALLRGALAADRPLTAAAMARRPDGASAAVAGLVLVRQRPGSANGVIFLTLEDETGVANVVIWPDLFERFRRAVLGARLLLVRGRVQKEGAVIHLVAQEMLDRSDRLMLLRAAEGEEAGEGAGVRAARDIVPPLDVPLARADEVKHRPNEDPRDKRLLAEARRRALGRKLFASRDFH
ncbi:MAG: error-prone DNA polymerase, partial [Alphaproteobacteria bacterium]|nr:error-prone DNA polymerase [Alphaproteobacteria bacterium]